MADGYCRICGGIFGKNRKPAYYRYIIKKKGEKRNGKIYSNVARIITASHDTYFGVDELPIHVQ